MFVPKTKIKSLALRITKRVFSPIFYPSNAENRDQVIPFFLSHVEKVKICLPNQKKKWAWRKEKSIRKREKKGKDKSIRKTVIIYTVTYKMRESLVPLMPKAQSFIK